MLRPIRLSPAVLQSTQRQQPAPLPEQQREKRALSGSAKEKFVIAMQDMVKVVSESESVSE